MGVGMVGAWMGLGLGLDWAWVGGHGWGPWVGGHLVMSYIIKIRNVEKTTC